MPGTSLNEPDAAELASLLRFLSEWMPTDRDCLSESLARHLGTHPYGIDMLRHDLARSSALPGTGSVDGIF